MVIKPSAIFLMTVLLASFASFSSPLSNFDTNSQNNFLNFAFADSENKDEKQQKKEEKLAEKQEKKEEKLAQRESDDDYDDENDDIAEFDEDVVVISSSTTSTGKTIICHIPPGNPDKAHTIRVGSPAVPAHLAHGDKIGSCDEQLPSVIDRAKQAEKLARLIEKQTEKEDRALERAEKLLEKLEQKIAKLEQRLQKLMEKVESGEYYGNIPSEDTVTNSYNISFDGMATSLFDDEVTSDVSGEIFLENLVTTTDVSKFKVTGGEIIVGNNIYDVIFGKARATETSDENNMVLILQTLDAAGNENTVRLTLNFDSTLGDLAEPIGFEIDENSKISGEWFLSGSGQLSLSS